MRPRRMY
uniref:Uncharacterized protein n=1 Tax=Strongyloides venezuelensis TaxID=75913 RepID=A0A1Y9EMV4_STRVS